MEDIEENTGFQNKLKLFQDSMINDTKLETLNQRIDETIASEDDQFPNLSTTQQAEYQQNVSKDDIFIEKKNYEIPPINIQDNSIQNNSTNHIEGIKKGRVNQQEQLFQSKTPQHKRQYQNNGKKFSSMIGDIKIIQCSLENQEQKQVQQNNGLQVLLKLKKNLEASESKIIKNLRVSNKKIRQFINDYSDNFVERERFCQLFCTKINSCLSFISLQNKIKLPLFHPQNNFKIGLDIIFCLINCLFFFFSSIFIIFCVELDIEYDIYNTMYMVWFLQITIKLNTAIYEKSNLIQNRRAIALKFIKKYALYDIIPFILITIPSQYTKLILTFKILQFLQLKNVYSKMCEVYLAVCIIYQNYYMIQIVKLMAKLFLIAHIIACLWYLLGILELKYLGEEKTWFDEGIAADGNWIKLYVCSLYWSLTLMTTGSNSASTITQTSFTSFIMLITTIIFGYLVNIIGIILTEADQEEEKQRKDLNQINKYMRTRQISKNLQRAINLDLEYYYQHNYKKDDELNQQVLSKISNNLLYDLKEQYFGKILEKIPFLANNFSQDSLKKIAMIIEEESYLPGQVIQDNSKQQLNKLIYIAEGQVKEVKQVSEFDFDQKKLNKKVGREKVLGEIQFFAGVNDETIYQACDFTQILTIDREKFLEVIRKNEKDLQVFCNIREKVAFYQDYEVIQLSCKVCFKNNHKQDCCPLVHFDKSDFTIKENFMLKQKQIRCDWERKKKPTCNSLMNQLIIEDKQRDFERNNLSKNILYKLCKKSEKYLPMSTIQSRDLEQQYRCNSDKNSFSSSKIEDLEEETKTQSSEYHMQRQRQSSMQKYKNQTKSNLSIAQNFEDDFILDHTIKEKKNSDQSNSVDLSHPSTQNLATQQRESPNFLSNQQIYFPMHLDKRIDKIEDLLKNLAKETNKINNGYEKLYPNEIIQNNKNNHQANLEFDQKRDYDIYFPFGNSKKILSDYNQKIKLIYKKRQTSKLRSK